MATVSDSTYEKALNGSFSGLLRWSDFDAMWRQLAENHSEGWYIYASKAEIPQQPASAAQFTQQLKYLSDWLKSNHQEDYCGIVYVDSKQQPSFVKIYDPNNLGVVCGISREPIAPAWILSKIRPELTTSTPAESHGHWWRKILGFKN